MVMATLCNFLVTRSAFHLLRSALNFNHFGFFAMSGYDISAIPVTKGREIPTCTFISVDDTYLLKVSLLVRT